MRLARIEKYKWGWYLFSAHKDPIGHLDFYARFFRPRKVRKMCLTSPDERYHHCFFDPDEALVDAMFHCQDYWEAQGLRTGLHSSGDRAARS